MDKDNSAIPTTDDRDRRQPAMTASERQASHHEITQLQQRIQELEATLETYEALLEDLPEIFERKFQQRLEPLLERYRLLARAQTLLHSSTPPLLKAAMRWRRRSPSPANQQDAA
jgi:hypothetical protein